MRFYCIIFIILFELQSFYAQSPYKPYGIKGMLVDAENQPVGYAQVSLYQATSKKAIGSELTKVNGAFAFNNLTAGKYQLKISSVGNKPITKDSIVLSNEKPIIDFGGIQLQPEAKVLDEVNIVGDRLKGESKVDKTVYNINPATAKASSNGMDVLKRIPTIQIDNDKNLMLEGSTNILVYVDGKETDRDYVYSLNPQLIDKIETINNPSSKYDASITGVINIILKHDAVRGGALNVNAGVPVTKTFDSDNSINYSLNYDKFTLDLNVYGYLEKWYNDRNIERLSYLPDTTKMFQWGTESPEYGSFQPILTLGYYFNKKNVLHLYARKGMRGFNKTQEMYREERTYTPADTTLYYSDKRCNYRFYNNVYSLFYKKTFDHPETELTTDMVYSFWNDSIVDYNQDWHVPDDLTTEKRRFRTQNRENVFFARTDFSTQIVSNVKLETGYAFSNQQLDNELTGNVTLFKNDSVFTTPAFESLKYDETRHAAYASFSGSINKFNWMAGLRFENSTIFINTNTKAPYHCWLPNVSLQQKLKDKNSIKLSYRRRINRPQSSQLNPFLKKNEKLTYEQGDPTIQPAYINSCKFSYTHFIGKSMLIPQIYFNYNQDNINRIFSVASDGILTKSFKNGGDSYDYGVDFSGQLQLFPWWSLNPYASIGEAHIKGKKNQGFYIEEQSVLIWSTNLMSILTFFTDLNITMNYNKRSPYVSLQTQSYRDASYSLKIEKGLLKQKAKIGIDVFTPFLHEYVANGQIVEEHSPYQNFRQSDETILTYNYYITLLFSYNFKWGQMENKTSINRNDINEGRGGGY